MKALKNLFAAVIAIAAIGLTVASHAGILTAKKAAAVDCYTQALKDGTPSSVTVDLIRGGSVSCLVAQAQPGKSAIFTGTQIDSQTCIGSNFFCCAKKDPANPNLVLQVFCQAVN